MSISAYQVDNIIKAYSRQIKPAMIVDAKSADSIEKFSEIFELSRTENMKTAACKRISNSLRDILLKNNE